MTSHECMAMWREGHLKRKGSQHRKLGSHEKCALQARFVSEIARTRERNDGFGTLLRDEEPSQELAKKFADLLGTPTTQMKAVGR